MNYIDLFSGIGGFRLAAQWAGMEFEHTFHSDIDEYANKVYAKHFPKSIQLGDITKIDWHELKKQNKGEWVITGGFPCQDISIAGKGAGLAGHRSGLWFEMQKAISILRPRFVIAENVGAITFRGLDAVLASLAEIGYDAEWQDIRASDVGAPHRRERIWIIAYPHKNTFNTSKVQSSISQEVVSKQREAWKDKFYDTHTDGVFNRKFQHTPNSEDFRIHDGFPEWVDRFSALGNSIVPQIALMLWLLIKPHL